MLEKFPSFVARAPDYSFRSFLCSNVQKFDLLQDGLHSHRFFFPLRCRAHVLLRWFSLMAFTFPDSTALYPPPPPSPACSEHGRVLRLALCGAVSLLSSSSSAPSPECLDRSKWCDCERSAGRLPLSAFGNSDVSRKRGNGGAWQPSITNLAASLFPLKLLHPPFFFPLSPDLVEAVGVVDAQEKTKPPDLGLRFTQGGVTLRFRCLAAVSHVPAFKEPGFKNVGHLK